jgi:hypothetical protein
MYPRGPEDEWMVEGLVGLMEGAAVKAVMGNNELQFRRWQVGGAPKP